MNYTSSEDCLVQNFRNCFSRMNERPRYTSGTYFKSFSVMRPPFNVVCNRQRSNSSIVLVNRRFCFCTPVTLLFRSADDRVIAYTTTDFSSVTFSGNFYMILYAFTFSSRPPRYFSTPLNTLSQDLSPTKSSPSTSKVLDISC